jgi:hypothetical protein
LLPRELLDNPHVTRGGGSLKVSTAKRRTAADIRKCGR